MINDWPTQAIILAAGIGRRLFPVTKRIPKPLLAVGGRPILSWILDDLRAAGVTNTCIVVNHLADQIVEYVRDHPIDGMDIDFRRQPSVTGTADALKCAEDYLHEPTFVLAADYVLTGEYSSQLKQAYLTSSADLVISLKEIPAGELGQRSLVEIDAAGVISRLIEKPSTKAAGTVLGASLLYIVPPDIYDFISDLPQSTRGEHELPQAIDLMLQAGFHALGILQTAPREWTAGE